MDPWPVQALKASLDVTARPAAQELPPLWHWLYFLPTVRSAEIGVDGHPTETALPGSGSGSRSGAAAPLRRMFASVRVEIDRPLRLSQPAQMTQSIVHTRETQGRSGPLRFVTSAYQYFQDGARCVREERDLVYLPIDAGTDRAGQNTRSVNEVSGKTGASAATAATAATAAAWRRRVTPDPILLFRFSALTFNAHRIHYDQQYAQQQEGHRERVVHGQLAAILLAELWREHDPLAIRRFELRARRPLFVNEPIELLGQPEGDRTHLRALDPTGAVAMEATAWS